jgi:hypothetical protein
MKKKMDKEETRVRNKTIPNRKKKCMKEIMLEETIQVAT